MTSQTTRWQFAYSMGVLVLIAGVALAGAGCPTTTPPGTPQCGNGAVETGEQCDDGNTTAGDGCSATCTTEPGVPQCGNGAVEAGEQCDDGNTTAGDGCSSTCQTEAGDGAACGGGGPGAPTLVGLVADKPMILPATVQVAYNDDAIFFHISWEGDRGDTHDYVRFTNGTWQKEGGPRRDGQATLDNDEIRGAHLNSTIYESRVTFMVDDPNGPNAVPGFAEFGCMLTCHDNSRAMPQWKEADGEITKYLRDDRPGLLDLWHHRLHRTNPLGMSDDQNVTQIPAGGTAGGRLADQGDSPWQTNDIDATTGLPKFAFDPATTGGAYAFPFDNLFEDPLRIFSNADSANAGPETLPVGIDYAEAVAMGYAPAEGDTIPFRRLRVPTGSRGDITAKGTTFTPEAGNTFCGRWDSNTQRLLDTANTDDTALAEGNVYNVGFAIHIGMVTVRDHYISFPQTLSLNGGDADIQAVRVAGSGRNTLPNWEDTNQFPVTDLNLFLPGITSYDFVVGENVGLGYIDPATGSAVDQSHGGSSFLLNSGLGCRDCHTTASSDSFAPVQAGGFNSGAMETLVPQRGGVNTPTPIPPSTGPG